LGPPTEPAPSLDPLFDVRGRSVVVTGGASGIGLGVATALLERGASVEVWDVDERRVAGVLGELSPRFPGRVHGRSVDVSDHRAVEGASEQAESAGPVDVLVNSAGISSRRRPAVDLPQEDWERMLAVNLTGSWNTCRAFGRRMLARRRGSVINVASTNSIDPSPGIAHYCVSKAGVAMLTKSLALEWAGQGVRVNALSTDADSKWPIYDVHEKDAFPFQAVQKLDVSFLAGRPLAEVVPENGGWQACIFTNGPPVIHSLGRDVKIGSPARWRGFSHQQSSCLPRTIFLRFCEVIDFSLFCASYGSHLPHPLHLPPRMRLLKPGV